MNASRPGIRSQFPKPATYLKLWGGGGISDPQAQASRARIERFAREGEFTHRYWPDLPESLYDWSSLASDLAGAAANLQTRALTAALGTLQGDWLTPWRQAMTYEYWADRIGHASQRRIHDRYAAGLRPQYLAAVGLHRSAFVIGCCLSLGWDAMALELGERAAGTAAIEGFYDGKHRRAPWFVLRLMARVGGRDLTGLPACASDEPLFETALDQWDAAAEDPLVAVVEAMLDRHTHEARVDSNKASFDFPRLDQWYVPYEVLAVLRLRQRQGLPVAQLQSLAHPLFATPLGRLHVDAPVWDDELLGAMSKRLLATVPGV